MYFENLILEVKTCSVVKHNYKTRSEVHSNAITAARQLQNKVKGTGSVKTKLKVQHIYKTRGEVARHR